MTDIAAVVQYDTFYFNPGMGIQMPGYFTCAYMQFAADAFTAQQPPQSDISLQAIGSANPVPDRQADKPANMKSPRKGRFRRLCFPNLIGEKET
jgi:hypothetical protein